MIVEVAEELDHGCSGLARGVVLEGQEVSVVKRLQRLVAECSINITIFIILSTLLGVLAEERLLVEGGCPRRDGRRATEVGRAYEGDLADNGVLSHCQDEPEMAVLAPTAGTIDQRRVCGEETMSVSNGRVDQFHRLIGEGWGQEAVGDGVDLLGVCHLVFFSLVADC